MSECLTVRDLVALRPSDWSPEERRQVEAHLDICPDCAVLADANARQDRLLRAAPCTRLTPSQRSQLLSRIQRERRRHEMRNKVTAVVGAAVAAVALIALALGLYVLLRGSDQPAVGVPLHTAGPPATPEPLTFAGEIRVEQLRLESATRTPISLPLVGLDSTDLSALTEVDIPSDVHLALTWRIVAPPGADWNVFVHLVNQAGALVRQSDAAVDWPEQPCPEGEVRPACLAASEHEWTFPADFPPGRYSIVAGLYDPETGMRAAVTHPSGTTMTQVTLGQVDIMAREAVSERARVTLHIFSGRPDPGWTLAPAQDAELRQRLQSLPATQQTFDDSGGLGYSGFELLLPAADGQPAQRVSVWKGVVRVETDSEVTALADQSQALERWLLDTAVGQVEDEVIEAVRRELDAPVLSIDAEPESEAEFALFLTAQTISPAMLSQADLDALELEPEPILSTDDVLRYVGATHKILLTSSAFERISQLSVPMDGRAFVVCVDGERIYAGAFWTMASSLSFDGVVIAVPLVDASLRLELGYPPSPELFGGEDLRSDGRILTALEQAGKLE